MYAYAGVKDPPHHPPHCFRAFRAFRVPLPLPYLVSLALQSYHFTISHPITEGRSHSVTSREDGSTSAYCSTSRHCSTMNAHEKVEVVSDTKADTSSRDTSSAPGSPGQAIGEKSHPQHGDNLDQAYWYVQDSHNVVDATPRELRRLRRKIDFWIVPIMFCCYTMQFIDKVLLNVGTPQPCWHRRPLIAGLVCCCHGSEQGVEVEIQ